MRVFRAFLAHQKLVLNRFRAPVTEVIDGEETVVLKDMEECVILQREGEYARFHSCRDHCILVVWEVPVGLITGVG